MGILFKYTFRNIKMHKFRTFLIVLSIMLPVALFFGSLSVSDAITHLIMENIQSYIGTAELSGISKDEEGSIKIRDLKDKGSNIAYSIGSMETHPTYVNAKKEIENVTLKGYKFSDIELINPIVFEDFLGEDQFYGKSAIIGSSFAKEEGLRCGDFIKLGFSDDDIKGFRIVGIAKDIGFFKPSFEFGPRKGTNIIVPLKTLAKFRGLSNRVGVIYFKMIDDTLVDETIKQLESVYTNAEISRLVTKSEIDEQVRPVRIPFLFMLILVVMISIFIIYTSFKVISLERLPMLGTFRSVGATKKMTNMIMLGEAMVYGIFGSMLGCGLGHLFLNILMKLMSMGADVGKVSYPFANMVFSFLFGAVLSMGSALIPIVKVSKLPIKEILLNIIEGTKKKKRYVKFIVGTVLIILAVILPLIFSEGMMAAAMGAISIVLMIFAWVVFVPLATDNFIKIFEQAVAVIFGNVGKLAVRNLRGHKSTYDNVVLISIGLASVVVIGTLAQGIKVDLMSYFEAKSYDIEISADDINRTTEQRVLSVEGVQSLANYSEVYSAYKYDDETFATAALGFRDYRALDFFDYDILDTEDDEKMMKSLFSGHNIVVGTSIRNEYDLSVGQKVTLNTDEGSIDYHIVGFIQTREFSGRLILMSMQNLRHDYPYRINDILVIRTLDGYNASDISKKIEEKFKAKEGWFDVSVIEEQKERNIQQNKSMVMIISVFAISTALIGSIGLMNNSLVNFLSRKKNLAIYASVGMSRRQTRTMLMLEAISGGIIGGVFGLGISFLLLMRISQLLTKIDVLIPLDMHISSMIYGVIGSVLICLLASISVFSRSKKLSVIEILRYE